MNCVASPNPLALFVASILCVLLCAPVAVAEEDGRNGVLDAMKTELERSMSGLGSEDFEPPYFVAYGMKDYESFGLSAKYGAIDDESEERTRQFYVEIRVGDYVFDNFANIDGDSTLYSDLIVSSVAPIDDDPLALRQTLWLMTDDLYKEAMSTFLAKQGARVFAHEDKTKIPSFTKEESHQHIGDVTKLEFDKDAWGKTLRDVSLEIAEGEHIVDSSIRVGADRQIRYYINSEGARIVTEITLYSVIFYAYARANDGMLLENGRTFYARTPDKLPTAKELKDSATQMITELQALRIAEPMEPYIGPAILAPEAAGVLFHEAIGHRLEGERQHDEDEGQTFKGQVGKEILPTFISVKDDPTQDTWGNGVQLNGHYAYDDEGVPATNASLVEDGVLKGFLLSRTPVEGEAGSNGHGRAQGNYKPMARMGNLIVTPDPAQAKTDDELKALLLEEVRKQGKPYGLFIKDITGGSTNTSGYGYQAFKGSPRLVYRVDAATGEETLVRGVELVGTPLTAVSKIVAAGKDADIFNGYCGAESGYVPVSTVSPAVLLSEIELQRTQGQKQKDTILPSPLSEK